ncbi:hypothetical protein [Youxingia wuxianensis]|uniref:Uncharacterized protein n=1 Tax=Youxingia wuxianensis TaxID=2763678 RepID=A0A926EQ37_9FIRM|nr:hypothetical protein [Youxingia wuxianensis]MBC8585332.1 hypothetical protein [Youxingia wuxianensis]
MFNIQADLEKNLQVYREFTQSRSSVNTPAKVDVPMVWDMYMDTQTPVGAPLQAPPQTQPDLAPLTVQETEVSFVSYPEPTPVTYSSAISGDMDILGLVNDRLKTQARRYPHPITNEMEEIG